MSRATRAARRVADDVLAPAGMIGAAVTIRLAIDVPLMPGEGYLWLAGSAFAMWTQDAIGNARAMVCDWRARRRPAPLEGYRIGAGPARPDPAANRAA